MFETWNPADFILLIAVAGILMTMFMPLWQDFVGSVRVHSYLIKDRLLDRTRNSIADRVDSSKED